MAPRLLDLFAGAQGCGVGYARAGFDVTAVDITAHELHPEVVEFLQADAMDVLADRAYLSRFDVVHASPPCQALTTMSNRHRGTGGRADDHDNLIPAVQHHLDAWGGIYVLENVLGARKHMRGPVIYTGGPFKLAVERPRLFESNVPLTPPAPRRTVDPVGVYGRSHDGRRLFTRADGTEQRAAGTLAQAQAAMGIDWMGWADLTEAIPPAYTEHIGLQVRDYLAVVAA